MAFTSLGSSANPSLTVMRTASCQHPLEQRPQPKQRTGFTKGVSVPIVRTSGGHRSMQVSQEILYNPASVSSATIFQTQKFQLRSSYSFHFLLEIMGIRVWVFSTPGIFRMRL